MKINLHVQDLVLYGFNPIDRYSIGDAFKAELFRLIAERGVPGHFVTNNDTLALNAGNFSIAENGDPATIGTQIAQNVYTAMQ